MLETQIEKLTARVAAVESKQDRTNELLSDILFALREGGATPPQPTQIVEMKAKATPKKSTESKEPIAVVGPAQNDEKEVISYTREDVCDAYKRAHGKYGKQVATGVVKKIAGDIVNITKVPESKFAAIIVALESYDQEEAA